MHKTILDKFLAHIHISQNCWEWQGARTLGYGRFTLQGGASSSLAHRISWQLENGRIPDGLDVLHKCDNPPCVRPDHLFLGTHQDNMDDMALKGRRKSNPPIGSEHWKAILTEKDVIEIRNRYEYRGYWNQYRLARKYGVRQSVICAIVNRRIWRHI